MRESDSLSHFLQNHTSLTISQIERICPCFILEAIGADEHFQFAGQPVNRIGFLTEGIVRGYIVGEDSDECIKFFVDGLQFIIDLNGFRRNKPAYLSIQAVTPCKLLTMPLRELEKLYNEVPDRRSLVYEMCLDSLLRINQAHDAVRKGTATKKYRHFVSLHPQIARQIPLKYVALYLDIAQQSLSRIRRTII